jgi:hypothetical protein
MEFIKTYAKEIIALVVPFLALFLNNRLQPRARLVQGIRHASTLLLDEPTLANDGKIIDSKKIVRFAQISFVNTGSEPATNLQITFNWKPQHYSLWPHRKFSVDTSPDDRFTILAGTLPPKDSIAIDILTVNGELPAITSAQCDECTAKNMPLAAQEVHPTWKLATACWFMAVGLGATVYFMISILQALTLR